MRTELIEPGKSSMASLGTIEQEPFDREEIDSDCEEGQSLPFDPKAVQVYSKTLIVDLVMRRIRSDGLNLHPDFQRNAGVWTRTKRSRLIESLLIRIPLPSFYFDASLEQQWLVVDGLQRLSAIWDFVNGRLRLVNLEFLHQFEGMTYKDLPSVYQRRIDETEIFCYLIMPQTPTLVKFNIFRRINTGGVPLSAQEMRQALYVGPCTEIIKAMAESDEFKQATFGQVRALRMADRECALRYLAFLEERPEAYTKKDFNLFLCEFMGRFNERHRGERIEDPPMQEIVSRFRAVMRYAFELLGAQAFRKAIASSDAYVPVNKALFEAWSVNLALISNEERARLLSRRLQLLRKNQEALETDAAFLLSVTQGTGDVANVKKRFSTVEKIIAEVVHD